MDAFFLDPNLERFPPESVHILDLRAEPYPDGRRVRVAIELTPFLQRPNLELELTNAEGAPCGSATLVEPMGWKLELTMHIRPQARDTSHLTPDTSHLTPDTYTLTALLLYPDLGETDRRQIAFELPPAE
ncbi:MAG: hypothetical protein ABWK53_12765 [Anaerolineales bacterium]